MVVAVSVVSVLFAATEMDKESTALLLQKLLPTFSFAASTAAQAAGLGVTKENALKGAVQWYF